MSHPIDIALADALEAEELAALEQAVAGDPALRRVLLDWTALRSAVASDLAADMPGADLFSLLAVEAAAPHALDDGDRLRLEAARPALERAVDDHPALGEFVRRLRADASAFDAAWESAPVTAAGRPEMRVVRADDRPAVRRSNVTVLWRRVGRIAAVFALISLGAIAAHLLRRDAGLTRVVAEGPVTIDLADGSSVELAAGAELYYPDAPETDPDAVSGDAPSDVRRYARLATGRALFRVARSAEPFLVETPAASVTVLGTTFGVASAGSQTEVVLVSGVVEVAARTGGTAVRLAPGESSLVDARGGASPATPADLDDALGWTGDVFLRAEPLRSAAARLGAAFGVNVEVDSALATEAVSGRFGREEGVDTALRALALAIDGRVERSAGGYRIVPSTD